MTTIQKQIAERLREFRWSDTPACTAATCFEVGDFDDILGKSEPTIEDVRDEAERVFGQDSISNAHSTGDVAVYEDAGSYNGGYGDAQLYTPTVASAYAALRCLPSKRTK